MAVRIRKGRRHFPARVADKFRPLAILLEQGMEKKRRMVRTAAFIGGHHPQLIVASDKVVLELDRGWSLPVGPRRSFAAVDVKFEAVVNRRYGDGHLRHARAFKSLSQRQLRASLF